MDYAKRQDKLRKQLKKLSVDALLVSTEPNVTYLTGFTGDSSYFLLTAKRQLLISDFRYITQIEEECPGLDMLIRNHSQTMVDAVAAACKSGKIKKLGFESGTMTVREHEAMAKAAEKVEFVATSGVVEELRMIKDKDEVDAIRLAVMVAEKAFGVIRASLQHDQTETEVANAIDATIRRFGGKGTSFPPIVGVGHNASLPHAHPGSRLIGDDPLVLIDWGARVGQYISDLTRVLVTGKISPKLERVYGVVLKANLTGIEKIRPGVLLKDVDAAARSVIEKAGYGKQFGHGLGHGIGLQVHESPRLASVADQPMQAGMVVTVEPGIYLPGWGGIRIEDDVLVTRNGCEVLSSVPKAFADCVVS